MALLNEAVSTFDEVELSSCDVITEDVFLGFIVELVYCLLDAVFAELIQHYLFIFYIINPFNLILTIKLTFFS